MHNTLAIEKAFRNQNRVVNQTQLRFPLYVYKHGNDLCFPNWSEAGIINNQGEYTDAYEQKINYDWAVNYYGLDFVQEILDPHTGFGFVSSVDVGVESRTKEFKDRLEKFLNDPDVEKRLSFGGKKVHKLVKSLVAVCDPMEVSSLQEFNEKVNLVQLNSVALEFFFSVANKFVDSYEPSFSVQTSTVIGSHVNIFKNKFDIQNFQLKLNVARLDVNLLKEATAFDIKELNFSDNNLLTLDLLNPVGNAQQLFLPIVFKTEAEKVTTVKSRKVEITTDYLLETLNDIDITELMNNICYIIDDDGNRIALSPSEMNRVAFFSYYPDRLLNNKYEFVLDKEFDPKGETKPRLTRYDRLTTPFSDTNHIPDNIACVPEGEITTGILLLRSFRSKILDDTKFTSTILPAKYPSFKTGIPSFMPALLPLLIITEFKYGLFLSRITFALTTEKGDFFSNSKTSCNLLFSASKKEL